MENNPFPELHIDSPFFLNEIKGRSQCPKCQKSRKFYCYTCYLPLGGEEYEEKVPKVKLPFKIDIIKHPQEVDGKSTAIHAAILAAEDVTIYTYPTVPDYPEKSKILLVFPGQNSVSFEDYVTAHCPILNETQVGPLAEHQTDISENSENTGATKDNSDLPADEDNHILNSECIRHEDCTELGTHKESDEKMHGDVSEGDKCASSCDESIKRPSSSVVTETENGVTFESGPSSKKLKIQTKYKCMFERVVFIDSTWHTVHKISIDERLKGIQRIELKTQKTKFWRHQADKPDTYLSTIEAIYFCLREYHNCFVAAPYNGEYDNLLFYFVFMYDKIRHMFEGGKYIKAYNQPRPKKQ